MNIRPFAPESWPEMAAFRPHVVVGTMRQLEMLIACVESGIVNLTSVNIAVLVLTEFGSYVVSAVERVILWQAFGVPVYELIVSPEGRLIASECEAHEGWHLNTGITLDRGNNVLIWNVKGRSQPLGMVGQIEKAVCGCGRLAPRILSKSEQGQANCVLAAIA